jgi:cellulose synthase/poly-beta-1,6-N-acetylglucosamine synthase-like glycosyltransferase
VVSVILIELLLWLLALATLVPVLVLFVQVMMALPAHRDREIPQGKRPRVAVLVPAHNEASMIADSLRSIVPQLAEEDRLLVVADNCSDDTATLAAGAGATVIERRDVERPGKNHALEFGVRHLGESPPDIVIIVDADCQVYDGAIDRLARTCNDVGRPVQSLYLMLAPEGAGLTAQVAAFAWIVKNWVRPLGMKHLGLPCQLMGTGTAFPWGAISGFGIANSEMAEDYKFGIDMALAGYPPVFCPDCTVTSCFPRKNTAQETQRTRWEHGHLQLILREVPRLLSRAVLTRDGQLFGLAMDLLVPPLAFLALMLAASVALSLAYALFVGVKWPLAVSAAAPGLFATAIAIAWYGWGRKTLSPASMLSIPIYVLWKIPIYIRFLTKRQKIWIKTKRD